MASVITLFDLTNLSIGTPEVGAVNFNALHTLLHAILKHLNIQELKTEIPEEDRGPYKPPGGLAQVAPSEKQEGGVALFYHKLQSRMLAVERQLEALNALPSGPELMERTKVQQTTTPVGEMWQMMQMKRKIEANEDGVSKAMAVLQDMLHEIGALKQLHGDMDTRVQKVIECMDPNPQGEIQQFEKRLSQIELQGGSKVLLDKLHKEMKSMQERVKQLEGKLKKFPSPDVLDNVVGWDELRDTLVKQPSSNDVKTSPTGKGLPEPTTMASIKTTPSQTKTGQPPVPSHQPMQSDRSKSASADTQEAADSTEPTLATQGPVTSTAITPTHPGGPIPPSAGHPTSPASTHPPGSPGTTIPTSPTQADSPSKTISPTAPQVTVSRTSSIAQRFPDTVEALRTIGNLSEEHAALRGRVEILERERAKQREQLGGKGPLDSTVVLPNLQEQLDLLQREMQNVKEDREKLDRLQKMMDPVISQLTSSDQKMEGASQISAQLGYLSANIQDIEKVLKELREKQEQYKISMEQSVASNCLHLQEQLDKLRAVLQSMVSSSSTLLNLSLPPPLADGLLIQTDGRFTPDGQYPQVVGLQGAGGVPQQAGGQPQQAGGSSFPSGHPPQMDGTPTLGLTQQADVSQTRPVQQITATQGQLTCPACSIDVSEKVSQLVSRYEQLQDMVTSYMAMQTEGKEGKPQARKTSVTQIQDSDLLGHIQNKMLQLQEECEKLNKTTGDLIQEHQQKQRHIDILYQSVEKLEEKKVDKEHIEEEIDVKADKQALERKLSRTQFDATMEQLNNMFQELLGKVSVQEQDWQRVLDKISAEMQSKLDRMELDPYKQQLEERWNYIHRQLQERLPQVEADEAAGIRKQIMTHFHCISCDRPLNMKVPGQHILTIPNIAPLPLHRSNRPHTVYELDQIRQQNRSLRSGMYQARYEAVQLEKSISHLRKIHDQMRKEMERVQIHFGGSIRASSQTIRDILHTQCITLGQYPRKYEHRPHDRSQEVADYGYISTARSCGGSHTMTLPYRRYSKLQSISPGNVPLEEENIGISMKPPQEEVDIMGFDGHIYKGRTDSRFPAIAIKEVSSKSRGKLSQASQRPFPLCDGTVAPSRPPSAKISGRNHSARLSQDPQAHPVSQTDFAPRSRETLEIRMDLAIKQQSTDESVM
ncbi:glutamine-rich protein 2 [Discoglossus pictus]